MTPALSTNLAILLCINAGIMPWPAQLANALYIKVLGVLTPECMHYNGACLPGQHQNSADGW